MKILVEAIDTNQVWRFRQTTGIVLRIYADVAFNTYHGQHCPAGSPFTPNAWYLEVPCTITGGHTLYIPGFEIDSTEDSHTNRLATYTAWLYAGNVRIGNTPFLTGFGVPANADPSLVSFVGWTWTGLQMHRDSFNPPPRQGVYDIGQVESLIEIKLGELLVSSNSQIGNTFLDVPPLIPSQPVAIGANSPLVDQAVADGSDILVVGDVTTVFSAAVLPLSMIRPVGLEDSITGNLRAFNKVEAVSFDVISDNPADAGAFGWTLRNL